MKVTFVTKEYPPYVYGGAGVHVKNLAKELSNLMQVEVRCFGNQKSQSKNLLVKGYREWNLLKNSREKHSSVLATLSADLLISNDVIDSEIVHTHTWYSAFAGYVIKKLYNIALVVTCHSLEPLRPWKVEQIGRGYDLSVWVEKLAIENADKVIAVSQDMKKDILKYFNVKEKNVEVIHNGIDLKKWKRVNTRSAQKKFGIEQDYILFFGRTTKQKGIEVLINAADYIDNRIKIVICTSGADTKEYLDEITKLAKTKKNIIWINQMLDEKESIELYSGAKVFVCPSIYEPFGIINLEAMSCEVPVVASAVGGIKEIVVNNQTGFLVPPGKPKEIAKHINLLIKNESMAKKFGQKGKERVEKFFGWDYIAKKTKRLYEKLV